MTQVTNQQHKQNYYELRIRIHQTKKPISKAEGVTPQQGVIP